MKTAIKILGGIVGLVLVVIAAALSYLTFALPNTAPAEDLSIEITEERVMRGSYLANHVTVCIDCHATRDWSYFSGPPQTGTIGGGGDRFGPEMGMPGELFAANITPYGIGSYTDGELFRLITTGVTRDNRVMFPMMPYLAYTQHHRLSAHLGADRIGCSGRQGRFSGEPAHQNGGAHLSRRQTPGCRGPCMPA